MTLIITVQARSHIVVTADGLCTTTKNGIQTRTSETLQKIFPLHSRGFAIAHHGENIIEGCKVEDIVNEFSSNNLNTIGRTSIRQIAQLFAQRYANDVKKTLKRIPESKGSGFLFLGFGITSKKLKIYETFWGKNILNDVFFEGKELEDLILSGDAKKYIERCKDEEKEYRKNHILNGTIKDSQAYCDKLYKLAENAQTKAGEDIFGGHKHQLVITKSGWKWLIYPK